MLSLNSFVLLKAVFSEELHLAVLAKDEEEIHFILRNKYEYEYNNGFIDHNTNLDIEYVYLEYLRQLEEDDFDWAL